MGSAAPSSLYGNAALAVAELLAAGMLRGFLKTPQIPSLHPITCSVTSNSSSASYPKCFPWTFLRAVSSPSSLSQWADEDNEMGIGELPIQ